MSLLSQFYSKRAFYSIQYSAYTSDKNIGFRCVNMDILSIVFRGPETAGSGTVQKL